MNEHSESQAQLILYQTEDGRTRIECRFEIDTVWLTQSQLAELFQTTPQNITQHLKAIFAEGELTESSTCKESLQVRSEGDIFATSVDNTPGAGASKQFFATVQNKIHWTAHGHSAAEVVVERANAASLLMGMMSTRPGGVVRKADIAVAKNYLTADELKVLNRIVSLYLEYAELQALSRKAMTMRDWITKLDEFLKVSGRDVLDHAGTVSGEQAKARAELEYSMYRAQLDAAPRAVDAEFEKAARELKEPPRPRKGKGGQQ